MDFLEYDIKDDGAFAQFISTMEGAGADIDGSRVMFESDNSTAKMLADTLVEYEIISPALEATGDGTDTTSSEGQGENTASAPEPGPKPRRQRKPVNSTAQNQPQQPAAGTPANGKPPAGKQEQKPAEQKPQAEDPNKKGVYQQIIEKVDSLGLDAAIAQKVEKIIVKQIDGGAKKAGDNASAYYAKLADNPSNTAKLIFGVIQKADPELFEELKKSGKLNEKNENTASIAQKTELAKQISEIVGQIEVPDAFNVEIDDSEWDNAVVTSFGFPMINLTSTLVREMLRAQEPKAQKRAYKEFKKQLKADPDVAKALGIGMMGTLGLGGGKKDATTDKKARIDTRTEGVNTDGNVLVEGAITDISNALKNPVDVLKSIAGNKGTPCRRNNLVVMYKEIDGKSGDSNENVTVIPLGVSGGTLVDLNKSVPVPMSHLTAFYSVVDPKASFKSYAKAMAEVNAKSDNASKGLGDAAAAAGKKLLSKIPLLGRGAKKELEAKEADGITKAMGELAMYIKENGHPPFYLLKPKSEPKEIDHWSDEDAANGYQMITMMVEGHKAGMIMKAKTAEALFKVG